MTSVRTLPGFILKSGSAPVFGGKAATGLLGGRGSVTLMETTPTGGAGRRFAFAVAAVGALRAAGRNRACEEEEEELRKS